MVMVAVNYYQLRRIDFFCDRYSLASDQQKFIRSGETFLI